MATIAKLDSNGVQVLPEGRTKTTSPQVHSSTDLSNTQEGKLIIILLKKNCLSYFYNFIVIIGIFIVKIN